MEALLTEVCLGFFVASSLQDFRGLVWFYLVCLRKGVCLRTIFHAVFNGLVTKSSHICDGRRGIETIFNLTHLLGLTENNLTQEGIYLETCGIS